MITTLHEERAQKKKRAELEASQKATQATDATSRSSCPEGNVHALEHVQPRVAARTEQSVRKALKGTPRQPYYRAGSRRSLVAAACLFSTRTFGGNWKTFWSRFGACCPHEMPHSKDIVLIRVEHSCKHHEKMLVLEAVAGGWQSVLEAAEYVQQDFAFYVLEEVRVLDW